MEPECMSYIHSITTQTWPVRNFYLANNKASVGHWICLGNCYLPILILLIISFCTIGYPTGFYGVTSTVLFIRLSYVI